MGVVSILWIAATSTKAADTLPARYTDVEFWRMVMDFSELGGVFPYENFVSNEVSYPRTDNCLKLAPHSRHLTICLVMLFL
jgi:hypothetical protein